MPDHYTITATLREGATVALYRGVRQQDGTPVVIKAFRAESPGQREIERLRHEYEIARRLDSPYLLKPYALDQQKIQVWLILEDFDSNPLSGQLGRPLEINRFLDIARQLAAALADIHRQDIVHKDLKPSNILIQPQTEAIKLTGFGIATRMKHTPNAPTSVSLIEGSLAYMSPEQTGRMNRGIDHRSDLYSLGVIFYQMLTGQLPFQAADPLEWVHCHIARPPRPPTEIVPTIPETLAAIVLKLLAKQVEDRYQSAHGLQLDLERCREQWAASGEIASFPLGQQDASDRFLISSRLYGREKEVAVLLESFEQVATTGRARFALVSGFSGIGKSALVREAQRPVVQARGYFIAGKFDQYQRDIPYATLTQAFHDLLQQILTESDERIQSWKVALEEALGANGRLIVDLIPQLELIIGPQPQVPELPPTEAQRRFHLVFQRFVGVFAQKDHPLVLFLDDLQWLDLASLKLMAYLMTHPDPGALFLIGAYRDNEVSPSHPLIYALNEVRRSDVFLQELILGSLSPGHLQQWVADTLRRPLSAVAALARLVYNKTAGNPFFTIQFLTTLYQEGLLTYDQQHQYWQWDLPAIRKQDFTDNVVELMLDKLKRFSDSTQQALILAACIGNTAEVHFLALLCDSPEDHLHLILQEAIDEGLVWRMNGHYKFLHDRVQEAAYALLPEAERPALHLQIGRLLLSHTPEEHLAENIFEIAGHLNRGSALVTSQDERERLAELNLMAGKRAKGSTAYDGALAYLAAGTALLAEDRWERQHELAFALEINRAECEFLAGKHIDSEDRLITLSNQAIDTPERALVACQQIILYTTLNQNSRAVAVGLDYLRHLGVKWQPHPTQEEARQEYERIGSLLGGRTIEDLLDLPLMNDPVSIGTLNVLVRMDPPARFTDTNLLTLVVCRTINLSIEHGNSDGSCSAYGSLGMIAGPYFGDYEAGFRLAKLACSLVDHRGLKRFANAARLVFACSAPWRQHIRTVIELLRDTFDTARRDGDLNYAGFCCNNLITSRLVAGDPLPAVQEEAERLLAFLHGIRFGLVVDLVTAQHALVRTLRGLTQRFGSFDDDKFSGLEFERHLSSKPELALAECWYWIRKLQARFMACDHAEAMMAAERAGKLIWATVTFVEIVDYHFFTALTHAACHDAADPEQRQQHSEALSAHLERLETWAKHCPENFGNRAALVAAEIARLTGQELEAESLYEQAIQSARENGFVQNEGLAYELAAQFYRTRGFGTIADAYLRKARACYIRWGADGKVQQLDQHYSHQVETPPLTPTDTIATRAEQFDLLAVIKASQAISREILLSTLQETLMRLALEHAAAQRGFLLLAEGESLTIHTRAEITGEETQVEIVPALPISATTLPLSLLNYVRRTGEAVVLADAAVEGHYVDDAYITLHKPRSALGLPIMRQARVVGLLYLENNLTAGIFTPNRLATLELLAAQAAVSLDNARTYDALKESEKELRENEERMQLALKGGNIGLFDFNIQDNTLLIDDGWLEMLGYSPDEIKIDTDTWWSWIHPDDQPRQAKAFQDHVEGRSPYYHLDEYRARGKSGDWVWLLDHGKVVEYDSDGRPLRLVGIHLNINERKRAEEEIRTLNLELEQRVRDRTAQLEAANKELEAFAYTVSHDLRAPLRHIDGFLELLQKETGSALNEQSRHYMDTISESAKKMGVLIDDLLSFSRMGRHALSFQQVEMEPLVRDVIRELELDTAGRTIEWRIGDLPSVNGDERMLRIVMTNLISNALKFTRTRQEAQIEIGSQNDQESENVIFVRDNGVGFDMAYTDKLFGVFQRLHRADDFEGTGIGLASVRRIIARHGGRTWAQGEPDLGAAFYFTLPRSSQERRDGKAD